MKPVITISETTWPVLNYEAGKDTYLTVHLFTQMVGKIKVKLLPWVNHGWHVALLVTPTGLTTATIPYKDIFFTIDFDFINHQLIITTNKTSAKQFSLRDLSVAGFYKKLFGNLKEMGIEVQINITPSEMVDPIKFPDDEMHATYNDKQIMALHQTLLHIQNVMQTFRSGCHGKCSPVHFFWGSFDMAFSRFSGKGAPPHPGGIPNLPDWVAIEAYSHEVTSCGFWPGNAQFPQPAFYAYMYPEPEGLKDALVQPAGAYYNKDLGEFILPYDAVQQSSTPAATLLSFFQNTYESCASLAKWSSPANK